MRIVDCKKGRYFKISGFSENTPLKIKRRLGELGFTKGQEVKVVKSSMLGKTYLIEIRKTLLTLRREVAEQILVEGI